MIRMLLGLSELTVAGVDEDNLKVEAPRTGTWCVPKIRLVQLNAAGLSA